MSDWFDIEKVTDERHRQILLNLKARGTQWQEMGLDREHLWGWEEAGVLTIAIDISDPDQNCVVRTLRVEFRGDQAIAGPDPTGQFIGEFNLNSPGAELLNATAASPEHFAALAAAWIEGEVGRKIERHQWNRNAFQHTRWVLQDSGEVLVYRDSANDPRKNLDAPDRIVEVRRATRGDA